MVTDDDDPDPHAPSWDAALSAAFARTDTPRPSVRIGADGVALPDADAAIPLVRTGVDWSAADTGRYRVRGEIARGAVGSVLLVHDTDLRRDVAIKVLHEAHVSDADLVRRFVEEAQIVGQLQHPGLVPVHELGLDRRGRPYFAMQVVRGRTLADVLRERPDPSHDRHRHLALLAQVCATMGYVHRRGVVHRDLKPANVLVGPLDETIVTDFGFAKVPANATSTDARRAPASGADRDAVSTSRDDVRPTLIGAVFGTPAYMAPEQARGDAAGVDARADVFALGAILCEVLTCAPPYTGPDALARAKDAALDDAYARLRGCGADAAVIDLALRCLAAAPSERPADAATVHRTLVGWRNAVDERADAARLAAATAAARHRAERTTRRWTVAFAVAVVGAVVVGASFFWKSRAASERIAHEVRRALLDAATRLELGGDDLIGARAAVERARAVAAAADPDPEQAREIDAVAERVGSALQYADPFVRIGELRAEPLEIVDDVDRRYRQVFSRHGLDVADPPDEWARRLAQVEPAIVTSIARGLEDWTARVLRVSGRGALAAQLSSIADRLDPDAERAAIRRAVLRGDRDLLVRHATEADATQLDPQTTHALALALLGRPPETAVAVRLLEAAVGAQPGEFWLHFRLSRLLLAADPPRLLDARVHARLALASKPDPDMRVPVPDGAGRAERGQGASRTEPRRPPGLRNPFR
jgi:hypothetical protein